jgi:hypothetical protein
MKNYTDMHLDLSKKIGAKIFPGATRGSPREVPKIQQGQIQPNKTSFNRENDADFEPTVRSVEIIIHRKETITKLSKRVTNHHSPIWSPEFRREGRLSEPPSKLDFVAFFKGYPVIFSR